MVEAVEDKYVKRQAPNSFTAKLFYPIVLRQAAEDVVAQIAFAIRSGAIKAGDWLPYMDELSELMQVSRPVIGEALKILGRAELTPLGVGCTTLPTAPG